MIEWLQGFFFGEGFSWSMFWTIVVADLLLAGDNAIIIAMVAAELPKEHQKKAIILGSAAAIIMRIVLTIFATTLLQYPYLKLVGGLLLLHIAVKLLVGSDNFEQGKPATTLRQAIWMILIADLAMSLDNVIAVAGAADGHFGMLIFGLLLSVPLIIGGSTLLTGVMQRYPAIIIFGAAMLGWLAGEMVFTDKAVIGWMGGELAQAQVYAAKATMAVLVVAVAWWRNGKQLQWVAPKQE